MTDKRTIIDKALLWGIMQDKDKWVYRAILLGRALEYLGHNPHNILNADKEQLRDDIYKSPEEIVKDFQI